MPIYKGTSKIDHLTKGSTNIKMVYRGTDLVYEGLPVGYTRKTYIEQNTGAPYGYVTTDFHLAGDSEVTIDFETSPTTTAYNLFGCFSGTGASDNFSTYVGISSASYIRYDGNVDRSFTATSGTRYLLEIDPTGAKIDGETITTWEAKTFTCSADFYIGYVQNASSNTFRGRIYDVKIKGVAHFVPCVRDADDKIGMYEIISQTFYPCSGTLITD